MTPGNHHNGHSESTDSRPPGRPRHARQSEPRANIADRGRHGSRPKIRIRLLCADIGHLAKSDGSPFADEIPIDAFAVGHYSHVEPVNAERALDEAISRAPNDSAELREEDLILTGLTRRGIITGDPAQPFFLPDPSHPGRIMAVAGMGEQGRFSVRELTLLARELCWSLGWLGKKHLATVLIGAGDGNVPPSVAVEAWLWGARAALEEAMSLDKCLRLITFIEIDPDRLRDLNHTLREQQKRGAVSGFAELILPTPEEISKPVPPLAPRKPVRDVTQHLRVEVVRAPENPVGRYRLSALTSGAAVADMQSDAGLDAVAEKSEHLMTSSELVEQLKTGRDLEALLVPEGIRRKLRTDAPLTIECDCTTAQIPWEMLSLPEPRARLGDSATFATSFWGLCWGLTRRIRVNELADHWTRWRPGRLLRVMVIADPSEAHPLDKAQKEGRSLKKLFDTFNSNHMARQTGKQISCELRLGPEHGTLQEFFRSLNEQQFDVLHFAGHCDYHSLRPALSGWELARGETFNADQLRRVNQVPGLVFANACSSGAMPDRSKAAYSGLAPTLAEAFFSRGVNDFVCTAWPVDDQSALIFARETLPPVAGTRKASPADPCGHAGGAPEGNG